jgi:CHAT domain-containing protein/tetratricopeptide (TPR) repeat protein
MKMKEFRPRVFALRVCCRLLFIVLVLADGYSWAQLQTGVVIENIAKSSEAERAGLQQGDVIQGWNRGNVQGEIVSPFDLAGLEIEQAPRGVVSLVGLRGPEKQVWRLGQDEWGIQARPQLPQNLFSLYEESQALIQAGKSKEAAERWRQAVVQGSDRQPAWMPSWFLAHAAAVLADAQQWKAADDAYQEAIQATPENAPMIAAQVLRSWAMSCKVRGDLAQAEQHFQEAAAKSQQSGTEASLLTASIFDGLCDALDYGSELSKAREYCNRALAIQQGVAPNSLAVAHTLNTLSFVDLPEGDAASAENHIRDALAIAEKIAPEGRFTATTLFHAGVAATYHGDLAAAEDYLQRALSLQQKLVPGSREMSLTLLNLGNSASMRGEFAKAERYYLQALAIRQKLTADGSRPPGILNNLGIVAWQQGDLVKAENYCREALAIYDKQEPDSLDVANTLMNLGDIDRDRRDDAAASERFLKALAIEQKRAPDGFATANTLADLGQMAEDHGDWTKAEECYRHALAIQQKQVPDSLDISGSLQGLGDVAKHRKDPVQAEEYYRRALAIREKRAPGSLMQAESLAALADLMRGKQQPEIAAQFYEQTLVALENQGQTARFGGSEENRAGFRAKHANYYTEYIDLLLAEKKPDQAFQVLERLRARALLETLTMAHVDIRKGVDLSVVEKEKRLQESVSAKSRLRMQLLDEKHSQEQVTTLDKEISQLLAQYKDVEEQIRVDSPAYAALTQPEPLSAKEVRQQLLDADTLLLEYSLGEEHSYVFAATLTSLNAYQLAQGSEIQRLAQHVHELLTAGNAVVKGENATQRHLRLAEAGAEYARAAEKLSRTVLGPVAAQLQRKRLLIVSDGALQYIPFAVLPAPSASASSAKPTIPLVASHEIVNLPSASVLAVLRREEIDRRPASQAVAVLADPIFTVKDDRVQLASLNQQTTNGSSGEMSNSSTPQTSGDPAPENEVNDLVRSAREIGVSGDDTFPRLPFTRREADAIYSTTGKQNSMEALDFDANKTLALSTQLKDYRIVHFATHGLLNNDHPELSGLVFSLVDKQGNSQDGFLRMLDIYNMELNADLVVLSACQTALGKEIGQEGLIGLTRGFMYAGAPRVVASLWKVDDEATAALMKKFYEGMLLEHQTPAQALRAAQLWMRTQKPWQSPYYWAGFVLQGEWK